MKNLWISLHFYWCLFFHFRFWNNELLIFNSWKFGLLFDCSWGFQSFLIIFTRFLFILRNDQKQLKNNPKLWKFKHSFTTKKRSKHIQILTKTIQIIKNDQRRPKTIRNIQNRLQYDQKQSNTIKNEKNMKKNYQMQRKYYCLNCLNQWKTIKPEQTTVKIIIPVKNGQKQSKPGHKTMKSDQKRSNNFFRVGSKDVGLEINHLSAKKWSSE